jgi:hypothetical protein
MKPTLSSCVCPHAGWARRAALGVLLAACALNVAQAATAAEMLATYGAQAGATPVPARGQQFFNTTHGREWQCATCHGAVPTQAGKHASTAKPISALAPAFNPERFTDPAKVEKWFRRNCNDVVGRECSAAEKADLLAWLMSIRP